MRIRHIITGKTSMKTLEQVKKGIEEWNNRLKNCQCHTPLGIRLQNR